MAANTAPGSMPQNSDDLLTLLSTWWGNFERNTSKAFSDLRPKDYIRLVVIVGAYALLRPYLMKLGAKIQAKEHEKAENAMAESGETAMNGNDLRGAPRMEIPGVDSDDEEEDEGEVETSNWGRKAKIRQRRMIRKRLEEHEERLRDTQAAESDHEIEEFLVD